MGEIITLDPKNIRLDDKEGLKRMEFLLDNAEGGIGGKAADLFGEDSISSCRFLVSDAGELDVVFEGDFRKFKDAGKLKELIAVADGVSQAIKLAIKQGAKIPAKYTQNIIFGEETARSLLTKLRRAERRDVGPAEKAIREELEKLGLFTKFTADGKVMFVGGDRLDQKERRLAKERVEKKLAEFLANGEEIPSEFLWNDED